MEILNRFVWGVPALMLIIGVGLYISFRTGFPQVKLFPKAFRLFLKRLRGLDPSEQSRSSYQALCTALAATVGTGNLAGVAGAIAIGGPGAVFWMWVCGFLGMATKFAEAALSVFFRERNAYGEWTGGTMYMIQNGMHSRWSWLASVYCFFGVAAAFGIGNATQVNAVIDGINGAVVTLGGAESTFSNVAMGIGMAVLVALMLLGGAKRVGRIAEQLIPAAAVFYVLLCVGVLFIRIEAIPNAFLKIFHGAFNPRAVTGGVIGSVFTALRVGAARGVFTNEAGMGTAGIAHGAADVKHPIEQGMMGIMEVFLDTIVICTMTALVILCSGTEIPYGVDTGMELTTKAFASVYGEWVCIPLSLFVCCFAIATVLGWGMYGARCAQFLFGDNAWTPFVFLQIITTVLGAVLNTGTIWQVSETVNGFMAIPNLIALTALGPVLSKLYKEYKYGRISANGGTYEDFNQRKPLRTFPYAEVPSACGKGKKGRSKSLPS